MGATFQPGPNLAADQRKPIWFPITSTNTNKEYKYNYYYKYIYKYKYKYKHKYNLEYKYIYTYQCKYRIQNIAAVERFSVSKSIVMEIII